MNLDFVFPLFDITVWHLLLIAGCAFLSFILSSVVGIGGTLVLVPVLVFFLPAAKAVAVVAPVMLVNNLMKTALFYRSANWRSALWAGAAAWPCAGLAATYTAAVDDGILRSTIGFLILSSLFVDHILKYKIRIQKPGLLLGGAVVGAASGFCGAAGAPVAFLFRNHGLVKENFVGTVAILAVGLQIVKIPVYAANHLLTMDQWPLVLMLVMMSICGIAVGKRALPLLNPVWFRRVLDVTLLVLALCLLLSSAEAS